MSAPAPERRTHTIADLDVPLEELRANIAALAPAPPEMPVERMLAQSTAHEGDSPTLFMPAFDRAVTAALVGGEDDAWQASQLIGAAAVAGHIEGVAAIRARKAPRQAFAEQSLAWKRWPLRTSGEVA